MPLSQDQISGPTGDGFVELGQAHHVVLGEVGFTIPCLAGQLIDLQIDRPFQANGLTDGLAFPFSSEKTKAVASRTFLAIRKINFANLI